MKYESEHTRVTGSLQGRYANYFVVGYNHFEIVIDFGQCYSEDGEACFHTRIITSPNYAAALLETLRKSLEQHGKTHECKPWG
jgi:hypothetical protein